MKSVALLLALQLVTVAAQASSGTEAAAEAARRKIAESKGPQFHSAANVTDSSETFEVGALYRGGIKRSFHELGTGTLGFKTLPDGHFLVTMEATVKNPQNSEVLECKVQREYRVEHRTIVKVSEKDWFNDAAAKHRKRFIDCVSLGYVVKWFTPPEDKGIQPMRFDLEGQTFEITYVPEARWLETTLRSADGIVGKFYLLHPEGGVRPVHKFRIYARDELVVSFVKKGAGDQP